VLDRQASTDGPPATDPGGRRITRRSLLASAGLIAGTAVATAAGIDIVRPFGGESTHPTPPPGSPTRGTALASPLPSPPADTAVPTGPTPSPPPPGPRLTFRSRPDLKPPAMLIRTRSAEASSGLLLLTPNNGEAADGPTIYDETGDLVWMHPDSGLHATNLQVIEHQGAPALCWWEGKVNAGIGDGDYVVVDASYKEIHRVTTAGGGADLHEFLVTPEGTALYFVDKAAPPPPGSASPAPEQILDCALVEIDLASGRRLFEWHSVDQIAIDETYIDPPQAGGGAYDYVHANSIDVDHDGTLLVSARNTSAVYKIDRQTGRVVWRLGGRKSDFQMGDQTAFGWQHDVRRQVDGTITIFDDQQPPKLGRGLVLELDEVAMTATFVRSYARPEGLEISSQGNMQVLDNGNVLVGWGSQPVLTEFTSDGRVVFDASLPAGKQSYRDLRVAWSGRPSEPPALALDRVVEVTGSQHRINAYASWNGATEVRSWRLLAGADADTLEAVTEIPRTGFETVISEVVDAAVTFVAVAALDAARTVLGTSDPVAATTA